MTKVVDIDRWWYKKLAKKYLEIKQKGNTLEAEKYVNRFLSNDPSQRTKEVEKVKEYLNQEH